MTEEHKRVSEAVREANERLQTVCRAQSHIVLTEDDGEYGLNIENTETGETEEYCAGYRADEIFDIIDALEEKIHGKEVLREEHNKYERLQTLINRVVALDDEQVVKTLAFLKTI